MKELIYNKLLQIVGAENLLVDEPMSKHTTFRIGGPADYFAMPETKEQVVELVKACKEANLDFYIIGNGSNLLVGDLGYRGVIIQIGSNMASYEMKEERCADEDSAKYLVTVGAGLMLSKLSNLVANEGMKDFEFASGIPGTIGGAVTMNAGAYGGQIEDVLIEATVVDENGEIKTLSNEELELGYRTSIIQKKPYIVLEAKFMFEKGDIVAIKDRIKELSKQRREKQPLEFPSAGSTFKRPEGYFAGKLVDDCGLRGYRVGNIMVSEKHCGFVINAGGGTAAEVMTLVRDVQKKVFEEYNVHLETEIRMIGSF
ncbi:MAG: UDP-N-acetylmuramate dehydrogenase [bacterium]|nr:UDP-N-acetylmuramate dehydrogenase [bacterium]